MDIKIGSLWLLEPRDGRSVLWHAISHRDGFSWTYEEYHFDDTMPAGFAERACEAFLKADEAKGMAA